MVETIGSFGNCFGKSNDSDPYTLSFEVRYLKTVGEDNDISTLSKTTTRLQYVLVNSWLLEKLHETKTATRIFIQSLQFNYLQVTLEKAPSRTNHA